MAKNIILDLTKDEVTTVLKALDLYCEGYDRASAKAKAKGNTNMSTYYAEQYEKAYAVMEKIKQIKEEKD